MSHCIYIAVWLAVFLGIGVNIPPQASSLAVFINAGVVAVLVIALLRNIKEVA